MILTESPDNNNGDDVQTPTSTQSRRLRSQNRQRSKTVRDAYSLNPVRGKLE